MNDLDWLIASTVLLAVGQIIRGLFPQRPARKTPPEHGGRRIPS